jgi:hypothetical protein
VTTWGADWPNVPRARERFLHHRKRRVRRREIVRLARRFRQWCRQIRAGAIEMAPLHRDYYARFADQPIARMVREELASRARRAPLTPDVMRKTLTSDAWT